MTIEDKGVRSSRLAIAALALMVCMGPVGGAEPKADAVSELLKKLPDRSAEQLWQEGGTAAVTGIVEMIDAPAVLGADSQGRLALHGLAVHFGRPGQDADRRRFVEALVAALESGRKATTKAIVLRELQHARGREAAAAIGKFLLDPELCEYATLALTSFADPPAAAELRRALPQSKGRTRTTLLNGLGAMRDPASAEAFRQALSDADRDTRLVAAEALAELGDAAAGAPRLQAAPAAAWGLQKGMLGAACVRLAARLVEQGKPADAERLLLQLWNAPPDPTNINLGCGILYELGRTGGEEANTLLGSVARGEDARLARGALRGMAGQKGRELTWFTSLADAKEQVRAMFIQEVAARGPAGPPAVVLAGLKDPAVAVQIAALNAVRGDPGADVLAAVVPLLGHADKTLRAAASAALGRIPGKGTDAVLAAAISGAPPEAVREMLAVLGTRLAGDQVSTMIATLSSPEPAVRAAALTAIGAVGTDAHLPQIIDRVLTAGSDEERKAAADAVLALVRRSPARSQAIAALVAAFEAAKGPARAELLRSVGRLPEAAALRVVEKSVADADPAVRGVAVQALAEWPEPSAIDPLRLVIKDTRESAHRSLALRGFLRLLPTLHQNRIKAELAARNLPKEEANAAFTTAYAAAMLGEYGAAMPFAEQPEERKMILQAIRNFPHATALGLAQAALADVDPGVRGEAEVSVISLAERLGEEAATKPLVIRLLEEVAATSKHDDRVKRCKDLLAKLAVKP